MTFTLFMAYFESLIFITIQYRHSGTGANMAESKKSKRKYYFVELI